MLVLVNNAGVRADGLAPMIDDEDWDRVIDTNLSAAFRLTRRALRPDDPQPLRPRREHRLDRRRGQRANAGPGELRCLEGRAWSR